MSNIRFHPVAPTGFGFDEIMARPDGVAFRSWYDATNRLDRERATSARAVEVGPRRG